ncbi:ribosomal-protein-alanine acetyltransferase [Ignisphaera aggregans DSM 17230]|uniref:Ribosomal-protein-alanine acetyltransferase n=1 Tax=Ignisphaera aggregans (strain DSM 17230 / JCM 13409 / AQ1.S1) TaxID=583356 RepID=E0SS20_IGNAA|nr:ribosomal-protein-alanine acetyltransferase [Ignisphaera aggregans DSM 17230]
MNIRVAEVSDIDVIYGLETKCFRDPYPRELLRMLQALYPQLFLVAEEGNRIIGYVSGLIRTDGFGHIVSICVDPEYRRRGVGRALMVALEKRMREIFGICMFRLEVRVSNTNAIKLYESLGYKIQLRIPRYYTDGEDAYLMIKDSC